MTDNIIPIQQIVNASLTEERKDPYEINSWHSSKIGRCLRGVYLERLGIKPDEEFDERTLRVFDVGKILEKWFIDRIKKNKEIKIETQVRVESKELDLSGYVYFVAEYEGMKRVYEVKSKHSRAFWYMRDKGEGAMRQHMYQIWIYLYLSGIKDGSIVYISKDDLSLLEYPVSLENEELKKEVLDRISLLNECWKNRTFPPMAEKKSWQAKYCRWHKTCQEIEKSQQTGVDAFLKSRNYKR